VIIPAINVHVTRHAHGEKSDGVLGHVRQDLGLTSPYLLYPFISLSFSFTCARLTCVYLTVVWMAGVPFMVTCPR
jgi:hypothetical protein